ncbi:MAG: hypothetical protein ACTSRB_17200 [Candidatus Helarchaeota archaeon]
MTVEKKLCLECSSYARTKLFQKLNVVFNNWCEHYQRPLGLCKGCEFQQPDNNEIEEIIEYEFVYY